MEEESRNERDVLKWSRIAFEGKGVARKGKSDAILEAAISTFTVWIAYLAASDWYTRTFQETMDPLNAKMFVLLFFVNISALLLGRGILASGPGMSKLDFRPIEWIESMPIDALKLILLVTAAGFLLARDAFRTSDIFRLLYVLGILLIPFYYSTRFYSSAGFARVHLLAFLEERERTDEHLESASRELNRVFNERGLRFEPCEFRAGVHLAYATCRLDDEELRELANSITDFGKSHENAIVQTTTKLLQIAHPNSGILPTRPWIDRMLSDSFVRIVTVVPSILAVVRYLLELAKVPLSG